MSVMGLDWNATRLRAVQGEAGDYPLPVLLDPPRFDLPLAIRYEKKTPEVGSAAMRMCRHSGHLVYHSFLPTLSDRAGQGPVWQSGRHKLDARQACELVWRKVQTSTLTSRGIVLS